MNVLCEFHLRRSVVGMDLNKKEKKATLYLFSECCICAVLYLFSSPILLLSCWQFVIVISPSPGCLGFISALPGNICRYWTINLQQILRRCSAIVPMHRSPPVLKKQGMLSPKNKTIFSCFPPQWQQNANLQPASLWSVKGYLRWIIYGNIAVVLNPVTMEPTLYWSRIVQHWYVILVNIWQLTEVNYQIWVLRSYGLFLSLQNIRCHLVSKAC